MYQNFIKHTNGIFYLTKTKIQNYFVDVYQFRQEQKIKALYLSGWHLRSCAILNFDLFIMKLYKQHVVHTLSI